MDGTLFSTDLLYESVLWLSRKKPLTLLRSVPRLAAGRAAFKAYVQNQAELDPTTLPLNPAVFETIQLARLQGRQVWLVTAANQALAERIADHLQLFDHVIGSSTHTNLKGANKLAAIVEQLDGAPFDYAGDSGADLPIWRNAQTAYVVGNKALARARQGSENVVSLPAPRLTAKAFFKAIRAHQWSKNVLLFVPLLAAHEALNPTKVLYLILAFIAFSLTASSVYLVNDLLDLDSDRKHHRKRNRPLARGAMSIPVGVVTATTLLAVAAGTAMLLPVGFQWLLLLYLAVTTAYSVSLKRKLLVDVLVLAGLYTLRVFAGGEATAIVVSPWLLMLSMFLFTSLAFLKRYTEIRLSDHKPAGGPLQDPALQPAASEGPSATIAGRAYRSEDANIVAIIGPVCGVVAVLVLALYISSDVVQKSYSRPLLLWGICPIALYWITRIWFLGNRGGMHDDPIVFAIRDRTSWITGGLVAALAIFATV